MKNDYDFHGGIMSIKEEVIDYKGRRVCIVQNTHEDGFERLLVAYVKKDIPIQGNIKIAHVQTVPENEQEDIEFFLKAKGILKDSRGNELVPTFFGSDRQ